MVSADFGQVNGVGWGTVVLNAARTVARRPAADFERRSADDPLVNALYTKGRGCAAVVSHPAVHLLRYSLEFSGVTGSNGIF